VEYTSEQKAIIKASLGTDNLLVNSVAGSGKTFILFEIFRHNPNKKFLLLSFNSHLQVEFRRKIKSLKLKNVDTMTLHKLAKTYTMDSGSVWFDGVVYNTGKGMQIRYLHTNDLVDMCSSKKNPWAIYRELNDFCKSSNINPTKTVRELFEYALNNKFLSHDMYMKLFQIGLSTDNIRVGYDTVTLDEVNDASEVLMDVFKLIKTEQKIAMGDNCLHATTRIRTTEGWRKLSSIVRQMKKGKIWNVTTLNEDTGLFEPKRITKFIESGVKKTYKLKTLTNSVVATMEHRFLTDSGWKRLKNITTADYIRSFTAESSGSNFKRKMLSEQSLQVLYGSILGDGHLSTVSEHGNVYRLALSHSKTQKDYLLWKCKIFGINEDVIQHIIGGTRVIRDKSCNVQDRYQVNSRKFIYNKLTITEVIEKLDLLGLAILLMDDGSQNATKNRTNSSAIRIHSNSLTYEENELLRDRIFKLTGAMARIREAREYFELSFVTADSNKLVSSLLQYMHPLFNTKFHMNLTSAPALEFIDTVGSYEPILSIEYYDTSETFDLTIEDNHNFVTSHTSQILAKAGGLVTHNCQALYSFLLGNYSAFSDSVMLNFKQMYLTTSFRCVPEIAVRVQNYMRTHVDKDFIFKGTEHEPRPLESRVFVTRTNMDVIYLSHLLSTKGQSFALREDIDTLFAFAEDVQFVLDFSEDFKYARSKTAINKVRQIEPILMKDILNFHKDGTFPVLDTFLQVHGSAETKKGMRLSQYCVNEGISLSDMKDTIAKNTDDDSPITISNVFKIKGDTYDHSTVYGFKSISDLRLELCIAFHKTVLGVRKQSLMDFSPAFIDKIIRDNPKNELVCQYKSELYMIYVAMSRAVFKLDFLSSGSDYFGIE
jgi:hypothetical protein